MKNKFAYLNIFSFNDIIKFKIKNNKYYLNKKRILIHQFAKNKDFTISNRLINSSKENSCLEEFFSFELWFKTKSVDVLFYISKFNGTKVGTKIFFWFSIGN